MFRFNKNKEEDYQEILAERKNFISIFMTLLQILKNTENETQAKFIQKLIELINQDNLKLFVKKINGVDMWGGAGAVWEIYIEDKNEAKEFEIRMLMLIGLMEKTKIIGKGIKPIKKIFENNLKTK